MASPLEKLTDLSLLEKLSEVRTSLLLANVAMYFDLVRAVTVQHPLPAIPSPWGDASLIGITIAAIVGLGVICSIAKVIVELLRQTWWILYYGFAYKVSWDKLEATSRDIQNPNEVSYHTLEMYLQAHEDKQVEHLFEEVRQQRKNFFDTQGRCAAACVLLSAEWFINNSFLHIAVPEQHLQWVLCIAVCLVFVAFAHLPRELQYIYMPGNRVTPPSYYFANRVSERSSDSLNGVSGTLLDNHGNNNTRA